MGRVKWHDWSAPRRSLRRAAVRVLLHSLLLLAPHRLFAQTTADTVQLRMHEVRAPRLVGTTAGSKVEVLDSATYAHYGASDLATLLANESPVFVKSYGLGSLATTSFRGGAAQHTAILWNGFNIQSPMVGQTDLSLIPLVAASELRIQYGGGTALWGSGAVGGAILLNDVAVYDEGLMLDAGLRAGSFGHAREQLRIGFGDARWSLSVAAFHQAARNDFGYVVNDDSRRQRNAELEQRGVITQLHRRIGTRQQVHFAHWYQFTDRNIPAPMHAAPSEAQQVDESQRFTSGWQHNSTRTDVHVRGAWFDEALAWYPNGHAVDRSRARTAIAEAELRWRPARGHALGLGINSTHAWAVSAGYPDGPQQVRHALFGTYGYQHPSERWSLSASVRQERMDVRWIPLTATIGAEHVLRARWRVKASASRVYRVPTFNDLYWVPGGDRQLRPEQGYAAEIGLAGEQRLGTVQLSGEGTVFTRTIEDWILWSPGPAYWSPMNLMRVWSRGVEARITAKWTGGRARYTTTLRTNHVVSTDQQARTPDDASVGRQLIYVPMYSGQLSTAMERGHLSAMVTGIYTGYRYTSTDNRSYLTPFTVWNAQFSYVLKVAQRGDLVLDLRGDNLLAADYQVIADRPMPGRAYLVGITYRFKQRRTMP
ncbi:MAG TPA: TonB-dependent receptor [Flavobacteriales bacterium]|nr:TonB-dependent receptor [Flavobacteriales bacterium]